MAKMLLEVLEDNEIELKSSSGGRLVAPCPFHDNDNEPYSPETFDYIAAFSRFDTIKKADIRRKTDTYNTIRRRRTQLRDSVKKRVESYVDNHPFAIDYDKIDQIVEPMNAWNDLADSKGLFDTDPGIVYDMNKFIDSIDDYIEEVEFAEGKPRTPKQRVELAEIRRLRPNATDVFLSDEED